MTVSELYKQVAGLGFESSLENDSFFYMAANRALLQVARIRPAVRTHTINHMPLKNAVKNPSFDAFQRSEKMIFEADAAKAYYFEAEGNGTAYVEFLSGEEWILADDPIMISSRSAFSPYRGFIKYGNNFVSAPVRIRFEGDYIYTVRRVAFYTGIYSDERNDIPAYEPFTRYDISALVSDFLALASPPVTDNEAREILNQNYEIEGGSILLLPYNARGTYHVNYLHRPKEIVKEADDSVNEPSIDLDEDLCALMPLLIAAYTLAEDESSLAEYYLTLYQQQAADISSKKRTLSPVKIQSNGW